jgi:23S rRNA pseudouridine1911/1915/1917 synthase
MLEHDAKPDEAGTRLDIVVADLYPQFSRSSLELLFEKDMVSVNGNSEKPSYRAKSGDKITVDETYLTKQPEPIDLKIIYENDAVIVIDKPAGILSHSKGALNLEPSVASFIKSKIKDRSLTGNRAGIVHRLDRGTSGVIITAKTIEVQKHLQKQFSKRNVIKTYISIVQGLLEPKEAVIDAPIGRNPAKPQTFKVISSGKPAQTRYKVIKEFKKNGLNYTLLELEPKTGRTHQLRVHLAYIGHPIVGDFVYGKDSGQLMLHANSIELTLPGGIRRKFVSEVRKELIDFAEYEK